MLLGTASLCILVLEAGSRLLFDIRPAKMPLLSPHPDAIYTLTRGFDAVGFMRSEGEDAGNTRLIISQQGLRGSALPRKRTDEYRALFLGDSYTFGWGLPYEDCFVSSFAEHLGREDVTAINGGVPGYGPWQERIFLNERCFPLEPDLVVFQAFVANDIDDTLLRYGEHLDSYLVARWEANLRHKLATHWQVRLDNFLRLQSAFAQVVYLRILQEKLVVTRALNACRIFGQVPIPELDPSAERAWYSEPDLKAWYPELEKGWRLMCEDIRGIRDDCRARGVEFAAFVVPITLNPDNDPSNHDDRYELDKGVRKLEAFFRQEGIRFFPCTDVLRSHPDPDSLSFRPQGHFNAEGSEFLGQALAAWLEEGFLPEKQ